MGQKFCMMEVRSLSILLFTGSKLLVLSSSSFHPSAISSATLSKIAR